MTEETNVPNGDYLNELYDSTFQSVYDALVEMTRKDPIGAMHHIKQVLKGLYVWQGNNWTGRGVVGDASIDASIAAHESILAELADRRNQ